MSGKWRIESTAQAGTDDLPKHGKTVCNRNVAHFSVIPDDSTQDLIDFFAKAESCGGRCLCLPVKTG
jgi:hypothetical protein